MLLVVFEMSYLYVYEWFHTLYVYGVSMGGEVVLTITLDIGVLKFVYASSRVYTCIYLDIYWNIWICMKLYEYKMNICGCVYLCDNGVYVRWLYIYKYK